jgi:hypothetical protein
VPASLKTFDTAFFSMNYSGSWYVEAAEADRGTYVDTTIRNSANPAVMVRIDVSPGANTGDPVASARRLELALRGQPGYRRLDFRRIDFQGYPALRWEFVVNEKGLSLRKVDVFFEDNEGNGFGVLTQAPGSTYALWRQLFKSTRASVRINDLATDTGTYDDGAPTDGSGATANGPPLANTGSFCDTHACISDFDNGVGSIVQCADGEWSHSGGIQGACSGHSGEAGGASDAGNSLDSGYTDNYGSDDGYTEDYGSGNGYTVTCADGTLSDSGGIQGACSHHGGVGG